jgi:hypothetical protein
MFEAIRRRSGLPEATLAAGLLVLLCMAVSQVSFLYDIAWHNTPDMKEASGGIFGLPHPWTFAHFGAVVGLPFIAGFMAALVTLDTGRRNGEHGLGMLTVADRRGPSAAILVLAGLAAAVFALIFDGVWHAVTRPPESTFSPPHLIAFTANILMHMSVVALFYGLALGPALAGQRRLQRRAFAGFLVSLIWLAGAVAYVFPFQIKYWAANTNAMMVAADLSIAIGAAIRLWPWRFPVLSILAPYIVFRAVTVFVLVKIGYVGAPQPLWPVLIAGLVADAWLLLPFNRARSIPTVAGAGLLFGLVWGPIGYNYYLPYSFATRSSLFKSLLECGAVGLAGALIGVAVAFVIVRMARGERPSPSEIPVSAPAVS